MNHVATLHPVFYGIAVQDIEYGSDILHVKVLDLLPNVHGEVTNEITVNRVTIKTPRGTVTKEARFTDFISATWLNRNCNRVTAPNVMYGERVLVWRDGDSENYYWESLAKDSHLRTTEHVIFAFSNTNAADRKDKKLNFANCYIMEFDTVNKKIGVYTNKNDGEPFAYSILLDTKLGTWKLNDDVGNYMFLDSANTVIEFMNKDMTQYRMDKKDILEKCDGNRTVIVGGDNLVQIGGSDTLEVVRNRYVKAKGVGIDTGEFVTKASSVGFDTPVANFSGHVNMASFAAGGSPGAGTPPRGEGGSYTGIIMGDVLVEQSITTPQLNATNINCSALEGGTGNFSGDISAANKRC